MCYVKRAWNDRNFITPIYEQEIITNELIAYILHCLCILDTVFSILSEIAELVDDFQMQQQTAQTSLYQ